MTLRLTFLGAAGTVTGSRYLLEIGATRVLIDCGLFQGYKQLRLRNWEPLPVNPASLDAVILTHAHLDHSGYLPLLVKRGYAGKVHCTESTAALCAILLRDSGHLQEEEAAYANRHGYSKHKPALPLYDVQDAERALTRLATVSFDQEFEPVPGVRVRFLPAGHILGAAMVSIAVDGRNILFTGDLGRPHDLIMRAPTKVARADVLVVESTYGDRRHDPADPRDKLADVVSRTAARGGGVIVPSFAVGRAQTLLYLMHLLKTEHRIAATIPIYLDSPMAANVTSLYHRFRHEHRLTPEQCEAMCRVAEFANSVDESKALDTGAWPKVIIAASGMATGGRVLHHLRQYAPDARNTILFSGFQAGGTRGRAIVDGAAAIKMFGEYVPVRAEVAMIDNLSAHADCAEILEWLGHFEQPPRQTFITHGEPAAADALRLRIGEALHWNCTVPDHLQSADLA
ncbi:MAG TPA: MBL fold metallo-hydrolase [Casimicrobiaceae bacterium]|nr:MBL fold metallo-hydrolase [Casimicrobiaceae bacterium]